MQQGGGSDTEVTWEDQQNINKFGRLNNRFHELEDEIKIAKETNDNLEKDEVEQMKEVTSKNLEKLEEERDSILAQMAELKKILYGKFKDSINLEED